MQNVLRHIIRCSLMAVLLADFLAVRAVWADRTNYVVPMGTLGVTPTTPFTNWATAATNIQNAVDVATNGDVVLVSNGVYSATGVGQEYTGSGHGYGTNVVYIPNTKSIVLRSLKGKEVTIINGMGATYINRCVCVNGTGAVVSGFTISNGLAKNGGGVFIGREGGLVSNCLIIGNTATNNANYGGGGLMSSLIAAKVVDCTIASNTALNGAGMFCEGSTLISNCTFVGNTASNQAGGVNLNNGVSTMVWSRVLHNLATNYGGGIYVGNESPVTHCVISSNQAFISGGGVYASAYVGGNVQNCLINGNVATNSTGEGGGIYFANNRQAESCTVVGNVGRYGGGLSTHGTNIIVRNCIVYSNTAIVGSNDWYSIAPESSNSYTYCCSSVVWTNVGNITNAPWFLDYAAGNYRLAAGSAGINVGTNQAWMTNDLDGHTRVLAGTVDLGAYEYPLPDILRVQPIAVTTNVIQSGSYATNLGVWFTGLITTDICWGMTITSSWLSAGSTSDAIVYPQTNIVELTNNMIGLLPGAYASRIALVGTNWMSANYPALTNAVEVAIDVMAPARNPTSEVFSLMQGYAATSRTFQAWNVGVGGMTFAVTTSAWWLSVSPASGVSTGAVDVVTLTNFIAAGLGLGTYYGEIHAQPDAGGAYLTIGVTVSVNPAPELRVSPGAWDLTTPPGLSPVDTVLVLTNASSLYSLDYTIASNISWVSLGSPATGTLAAGGFTNITVKYQTATLSAGGTYTGVLTVAASNGAVTAIGSPQTVAIIVHVSANPLLQTTPAGLTNAVVTGQDAADQYFEVWNGNGTNALAYTITGNVPWLVMSPVSGTSTGQHDRITVRYSTAGLNPGETSAAITVRATDGVLYQATNQVSVTLRVQALAELATTAVDYQATIRQGAPLAPLSIQIWNKAVSPRGQLIFTNTVIIAPPASAWLTVSPGSGASAGEVQTVTLSFNTAGLSPLPRPHRGVLRITGVDEETGGSAVGSPLEFTVEVTVNRGVGLDFTGQGSAAMVVYHEPTGMWYLKDFMTGNTWSEAFGGSGYQPVVGDYDGDGVAELGVYAGSSAALYVKKAGDSQITVFPGIGGGVAVTANIEHPTPGSAGALRPGESNIECRSADSDLQLVLRSPDGEANRDEAGFTVYSLQPALRSLGVGGSSYVPFAGDYDGDGKTDPAVFSDAAGYWWVLLSQSAYASVILNTGAGAGYVPVSGDFDGDGIWDPAVYQGTAGAWYALLSGAGYPLVSAAFGDSGVLPVTGDYDGDGLADPGIFNPTNGVFAVLLSANGYTKANVQFTIDPSLHPTAYSPQPIAGDYDGDGRADPTVYAPDPAVTLAATNGYWQIMLSGNAYVPMPLSFGPRRAQAVGQ